MSLECNYNQPEILLIARNAYKMLIDFSKSVTKNVKYWKAKFFY